MSGSRLSQHARRLADALEDRLDVLVGAMVDRLMADPSLAHYDEPQLRELTRAIAEENLRHEIRGLQGNGELPSRCPPEAARAAQQAVLLNSPVTVALQCYRAGHAVLWDTWLDLVAASGHPAHAQHDLLRFGSEFMFAYVERCTGFVVEEYTRARAEADRSRDHLRLRLVHRVLDGGWVDDTELSYRLNAGHIGLVATGPGSESMLNEIANAGRDRLILPGDDGTTWAWVAGDERDHGRVMARFSGTEVREDGTLACGVPARGPEGFRRTHRQALDAYSVASRRGLSRSNYRDASLEALALASEERARELVEVELGSVSGASDRAQRLRATLNAYFATGQNAAAAAARLGVNERTVRNRLASIEQILGTAITERWAELATALRFGEVTGSPTGAPQRRV
jgi:hypothetical protein